MFQVENSERFERRLVRLAPGAVLVVFCFLVYSNSLAGGFVWDDHKLIEINAANASLADIPALWTQNFWQSGAKTEYYRPLTAASFVVDHHVFNGDPRGFRLTNIALYAALCLLAYYLLLGWTRRRSLALAWAMVYAALPAHVENTAWIAGRTDILCGLLMFASLLLYLRALREGGGKWPALSVLLFVLSLFAKEMSITLVAIVALHQLLWNNSWKGRIKTVAPYLIAALLFMALHYAATPHLHEENVYPGLAERAASVLRNLGLGVRYSLLPGGYHLVIAATREEAPRAFAPPGGFGLALTIAPLAAAAAALGLSWLKRRKTVFWLLGSGLLALMPVVGIVPIGVVFAPRFLLIPSFFLAAALAVFVDEQLGRFDDREKSDSKETGVPSRAVVAAVASVYLLAFFYGTLSFLQSSNWRSDARLMRSVLEKREDLAMAHFLLGNGLVGEGDTDRAVIHFERALELRPSYPEALFNLGVIMLDRGRAAEAEKRYREALEANPGFVQARMALAELLARTGREAEARRLLKEAPDGPLNEAFEGDKGPGGGGGRAGSKGPEAD